eukprot:5436622-Amphidinium_carterae.1
MALATLPDHLHARQQFVMVWETNGQRILAPADFRGSWQVANPNVILAYPLLTTTTELKLLGVIYDPQLNLAVRKGPRKEFHLYEGLLRRLSGATWDPTPAWEFGLDHPLLYKPSRVVGARDRQIVCHVLAQCPASLSMSCPDLASIPKGERDRSGKHGVCQHFCRVCEVLSKKVNKTATKILSETATGSFNI